MEMQYKEWILETIDSLRTRKARPDVERICRMIERKHGLSPAETQQQLEKLVRAELVIKVAYKGSNSYRNAAKWYKNKQRKKAAPASPEDGAPGSVTPAAGSRSVVQAVSELLQRNQRRHPPQPQHHGCQQQPARYSSPSGQNSTPGPGEQAEEEEGAIDEGWRGVSLRDIEKHLAAGTLQAPGTRRLARARLQLALKRELSRGRLLQTASGHYLLPPPPPGPGPGPGPVAGRRRKKERLELEGAPLPPEAGAALGHKGCARTRKEKTIEANALLINPPAAAASLDSECMEAELKEIEEWNSPAVPELRGASCLPTPSASPVEMETIESGSTKSPTENSKLLDPAEWTILDVFNYFKKAGFEDQAVAFQEQEIDGKSLLLMKRSDVLTGLSIKLGPALKIYEYHVKALQLCHLKSSSL
ncbi:sterile alpha motif domain-containing protein 13 isoform X3 [Stegostoma tigrinum]|uniref:sterile alpha motif domain-containing protein 13 isoform X3 n=1 Tax=Stegostoma tigrinum TaxID=3053191 RepID=UPI00286FD02C|nr:sterile alpha motif domain-containing protein 13 isoform X3 [Stegostoma tigrinum]